MSEALNNLGGFPMVFESGTSVGGVERGEDNKAAQDMEARYGQAREEDYAKRDRVLNRVMSAKDSKDVYAALEMVKDYENVQFGESIDRYTYGAYKRAAIEGQRNFEKGSRGILRLDAKKTKEFADKVTQELKDRSEKNNLTHIVRDDDIGNLICDVIENQGSKDDKNPERIIGSYDIGVTYELRKEGVIEESALIDGNGDLLGNIRVSGYAISVSEKPKFIKGDTITEIHWAIDPNTLQKDPNKSTIVEKPSEPRMSQEVTIHFGTEKERLALANAHEQLHQILITGEALQNQAILINKDRAALEAMVKEFYQYEEYFSNLQHKWFFEAADISKMDYRKPETLDNKELGQRRDKAMRLYYLVGMSETKEKMEKHLNTTNNLEEILGINDPNDKTLDRVLRLVAYKEPAGEHDAEKLFISKYDAAVKFLIGKDVKIVPRTVSTKENRSFTYECVGWLPAEERDPAILGEKIKKTTDKNEKKELKAKMGEKGVEYEADEKINKVGKMRGFLTEYGNPYVEGYRDKLFGLMERFGAIVDDGMAVTEAGRYFWTRGMRDELGMEVYSFISDPPEAGGKAVKFKVDWRGKQVLEKGQPVRDDVNGDLVPNLPTGEELLRKYNTSSFADWEAYCQDIEKRYLIPGEPVATDLSKIFYPKMWRLKEMMKDRSAGPYLTYDKFDFLTQSQLSLCRVKIETGKDENGPILENRSIREAWLGYKSKDGAGDEKAIDLGDIDWEQAGTPPEVAKLLSGNGAELELTKEESEKIGQVKKESMTDNADAYFWVMNYLAGDDNPAKRPWQFIMKGVERMGDMQKPEAYTDKIKFWKIIWHPPALAWGNWRKLYEDKKVAKSSEGDTTREKVDGVDGDLGKFSVEDLNRAKKDWFVGLRSLPDYPFWAAQMIDSYNDNNEMEKQSLGEYVAKMAIRYGFLEVNNKSVYIRKLQRMKI